MIKYLEAELYKVTHRRAYVFGSLAVILGGIALLHILLCYFSDENEIFFDMPIGFLKQCMAVGPYLALMISDMVFSDQYKINALKNEVSYGLPRRRCYLGKLLAAAVTAVVYCAVMVAFYLALSAILFPVQGDVWECLTDLACVIGASFPLWLGALGFVFMLLFLTKGSTMAVVLFILVMGPMDAFIEMIQMFVTSQTAADILQGIRNCLLCNGFDSLITQGSMDMAASWRLGIAWLLVTTAIGLFVFEKREIS